MNVDRLNVYFLRGLFGRPRSFDLQKLAPFIWFVLKGISQLAEPESIAVINKYGLRFTVAGVAYYARMRHISNGLPRRIEIVNDRGKCSPAVIFFSTLAQAQAFARRPAL